MRRSTTPTHTFNFPSVINVSNLDNARIVYSQCGETILEKSLKDVTIDSTQNALILNLNTSETQKFTPGKALIQLMVKINDKTLASQMIWLIIKPVLNSEEL